MDRFDLPVDALKGEGVRFPRFCDFFYFIGENGKHNGLAKKMKANAIIRP